MPRSIKEIRQANGGLNNLSDEEIVQSTYSDFSSYYKSPDEYAKAIGYSGAGRGLASSRISAGVDEYQSNLYGVLGAASRAAGAPAAVSEFADRRRDSNKKSAEYAQTRSKELGGVDDWREVDGVGSGLNYLGGLAAQSLPYVAEGVVGGLTGGAAFAGTAARVGLTGAAARTAAGVAGATIASYPSAVGDILSNQRDQNGGENLGMAAVGGVPYALLNAGLGVEGRLAKGALARNSVRALDDVSGVRGGAARAATTAGKTALGEGVSEAGQELVNQRFGRMAVDDQETLFNPEANKRYVDSFVGGAALGGVFGGAAGGWRRSEGFTPAKPGATEDLLDQSRPQFDLQSDGAPLRGSVQEQEPTQRRAVDPNQRDIFNPDGSPTYGADTSFGYEDIGQRQAPDYQTSPGAAPERPGMDYRRDMDTGNMTLQAPIDRATPDMFGGEPGLPAQQEENFELSAPGSMQDSRQQELDLAAPEQGNTPPQLANGNQRGITGQLQFSGNTRSPKGQVLQGFVDSLTDEGHMDEGTQAQASTLIAQSKFAAAKKLVDVAVKDKMAADSMLSQITKIAKKNAPKETTNAPATASNTPASTAVNAAPRADQPGPGSAAVASAVEPTAPAAAAVQSGESGNAADTAVAQPVSPLKSDTSLIESVESAVDDAEYKTAIDELYKRWADINSEHPEIESYLEAEIGTKPAQRAFSKEWRESEDRVESANREGKRGLKVGQSQAGTQSAVDPNTDNILRGLAMPTSVFRSDVKNSAGRMSEQNVTDVVNKTIAALPDAPRIIVSRNPTAAGVPHAGGVVPVAGLSDGSIYVFADEAESALHVQESVFHELFHYGLRSLLTQEKYHQAMRYLRSTSPQVYNLGEQWKRSKDGVSRVGTMSKQDYDSLATEEALAVVSEQINTGKKIGSDNNPVVRQLASWMAKLADVFGMKELAQSIRRASYSEAEKFVQRAVANAGESQRMYDTVKDRQIERGDRESAKPVFRSKEKAEPAHPVIEKVSNFYKDFLKDPAKKGLVRMAFTNDLARLAVKLLPSAEKYVSLMDQRAAVKTRYERKVHEILEAFGKLPQSVRGTGPGSVNDFLQQSTTSSKWGYAPANMKGVVVDPGMAVKFRALPVDAQNLIKDVFEHGSTTLKDMKKAVMGNITSDYDLLIAEAKKAGDTTEMASLEKKKATSLTDYASLLALSDGQPYAPLKRFGNHVVVGMSQQLMDAEKNLDWPMVKKLQLSGDHYFVQFAETSREASAMARDNEGKYALVQSFEKDAPQTHGGRDLLGAFHRLRTIAQDTDGVTDGAASKGVNRLINDLHFVLLSEQSARQAERTRRNISGADKDMMRAFVTQGRATAQFIASLHNNGPIYDQLRAMKTEADARTPGRDERREYYNEFMKRHAMGLEYQPSPIADKALGVSSVWLLLTNPAYYLQNATQPLMMSLPVVAGKHGYAKSWGAFTKAYGEVSALLREEGLSEKTYAKLPEDVRYAIERLVDGGSIDITMDQDMGRWRSDENSKMKHFGNAVEKLRKVSTDLEAINRVVTGVAAYRLDKAAGQSEENAIKYAGRMIYDTHGDYSGFNAPRVMRTPVGRVVSQFRKFQGIQISLIAKLASQAFKGATADERAIGRAGLAYTLTHCLALGGAMALPGFSAIAWIVGKVFGDDDEPDNAELKLRRAIGNESLSDLLLKGVPKLGGVDLSGKLGMGTMLSVLPFSDGGLSREGYAQNMVALLGPFLGGLGPKAADGLGRMKDGDYYKGLESLAPTGLANAMRALRMSQRGDTQRNGDVTMAPDEISVLDASMVALGLPTNTVTDKRFLQGAKFEYNEFFTKRSRAVLKDYSEAYRSGDGEALAEARTAWGELQAARKRNGYAVQPMSTLLKAPGAQRKREANTAGGVQFKKDNRQFVEETSEL